MNRKSLVLALAALLAALPLAAQMEVYVGRTTNDPELPIAERVPWPYKARVNPEEPWDSSDLLDLSAAPFVDYMVANHVTVPGIIAEKISGPYLDATQTDVWELPGGANGSLNDWDWINTPTRWINTSEPMSIFMRWSDGTPLPSADVFFGVSWGGTGDETRMQVRVELASEGPIYIHQWFNNGDFGERDPISGLPPPHELTIEHYAADGTLREQQVLTLPLGGAGGALQPDFPRSFLDNRQFFSAEIKVERQAPGDYVLLKHRCTNMGYKGTAITLTPVMLGAAPDGKWSLSPDQWSGVEQLGWAYGASADWGYSPLFGWIAVAGEPHLYSAQLGWLTHAAGDALDGGAWFRSPELGWVWAAGVNQVWRWSGSGWTRLGAG